MLNWGRGLSHPLLHIKSLPPPTPIIPLHPLYLLGSTLQFGMLTFICLLLVSPMRMEVLCAGTCVCFALQSGLISPRQCQALSHLVGTL